MGPIGTQELIIIAVALGLLLVPAALIVGLVIFLVNRSKKSSTPPQPPAGERTEK